jgi:hypothetical protein
MASFLFFGGWIGSLANLPSELALKTRDPISTSDQIERLFEGTGQSYHRIFHDTSVSIWRYSVPRWLPWKGTDVIIRTSNGLVVVNGPLNVVRKI